MWFPNWSDTNQAVQSQKQARSLKFRIKEEEVHYPCSENKGADQLRGGSNEYPQSMFWSKNKKYRYTPAYPRFAI